MKKEQPPSELFTAQPVGSGPPAEGVTIEVRDIHKGFGTLEVLKGVSFAVPEATSAVVMGGSGTGKSVTIKNIVRLLEPDQGEVWADGIRIDQLDQDALDDFRLSTGYLFQSGALFDSMTVYENLAFIIERNSKLDHDAMDERITEILEWVNLGHTADMYPSELSGGQRKRIGLARAIVLKPKIMFYDEPTTGLDPISVRVVSELIVRLRDERGITSVTITHDLLCTEIIADQIHFLHDGRIVESGTLDQLRQSNYPAVREFFGL